MAVVRRDGKWTLEKVQNGVYEIKRRGDLKARVITDEYEPTGMIDEVGMDVMTRTIEVRNFKGAEQEFQKYAKQSDRGGSALGGGFGLFR
ncbi:hypothetical protein [Halomarina pelagica]|uniref:hypothetical protein n=1 Tax=Halomarina pelagica TaxID=2961599 RepID=UPI0020C36331|nr:hypothetical protein [Halomarina sp. BND7]